MSFELHYRKHIEDELTEIVRQQLRKTAHALTTSPLIAELDRLETAGMSTTIS